MVSSTAAHAKRQVVVIVSKGVDAGAAKASAQRRENRAAGDTQRPVHRS